MGIRGFGKSIEEAFENAALAMIAVNADLDKIKCEEKVTISCSGEDLELLFIAWLNNLLYEMVTRKMFFSKFKVEIKGSRLEGNAWGEKLDIEKHEPRSEIKGISYSDLKVTCENGKWTAQCIVDL